MKTSNHLIRLPIPLMYRIISFEALLLCIGIIGAGLFFISGIFFIDELLIAIISLVFGIAMTTGGICLSRHFLPNLFARVTISEEAITWAFAFRSITISTHKIKYTDVVDYKHAGLVPYLIIATKPVSGIPLNKLKRGKGVIFFQLHEASVPILHRAIPKPYNQVLNKYLYKSKNK